MGLHSKRTSPTIRNRRIAGAVIVIAASAWGASHATPATPTAVAAPAPTADTTPLRLAELYRPAKDTSGAVDTPAATAFLASLRQAGVTLAGDREDAAIDLARQAAESRAPRLDVVAAVHTLLPELNPDQVAVFVTGALTYF